MIAMIADSSKGKMLIIGLSYRNLELLKAGQPIEVNQEVAALAMNVFIYAGKDEQSLVNDLIKQGLIPKPVGYEYQYDEGGGPIAIKCLKCGATSHNRQDVEQRYCGRCHVFHEQ